MKWKRHLMDVIEISENEKWQSYEEKKKKLCGLTPMGYEKMIKEILKELEL